MKRSSVVVVVAATLLLAATGTAQVNGINCSVSEGSLAADPYQEPGLAPGVLPPGMLLGLPFVDLQVTIGHEVHIYNFIRASNRSEVIYDGTPIGTMDIEDATHLTDSLCPNGAVSPGAAKPAPKAVTGTARVSGQAAGRYAVADFNGDGAIDSAQAGSSQLQVTLRDASGAIVSKQNYLTGGQYQGDVLAADFNGDGITDLAVSVITNDPTGSIAILLGKGDGTFGAAKPFPAGPTPIVQAAVDMNGDGKLDLVVANPSSSGTSPGTVSVLNGNGDGTFGAPVSYTAGVEPISAIAADLNGDGRPDLAVIDNGNAIDRLLVLLGQPNGTLGAASAGVLTGTNFGCLSFTDLNNDGNVDLIIADRRGSDVTVLLGNGNGTFQSPAPYVSAAQPGSVGIIPLADGTTALLTGDSITGFLTVNYATASGKVYSAPIQTLGTSLTAVTEGDLNGDGKSDLVVTDHGANRVLVRLNSGSGQFASAVPYTVTAAPQATAIADINGDGKPDLVVADGAGVEILPGKGDGTFGAIQTTALPGAEGGVIGPVVADFNGDGKLDIAVQAGSQISLLFGAGNGSFTPGANALPAGTIFPAALAAGDFNGDGKADLALAYDLQNANSTVTGAIQILLSKGDGTFQSPSPIMLSGTVVSLTAGDVNKDGKPDLIAGIQTNTGNQIVTLLGSGGGSFQNPLANKTGTSVPSISVADINGDGKPDLVIGDCCGLSELTFMLGKGDGTFQTEVGIPSGPDPAHVALGDVTGGGKPDLVIAGNWQGHGTLVILRNYFPTPAAVVSSADPYAAGIAPGSLATAYGTDLSNGAPNSTPADRPVSFEGTSVAIVDSTGATTAAPLVYVSSGQVNFLVPSTVPTGSATVVITSGDGARSVATVQIAPIAPGVFTLNASGLVAAVAIRVAADNTQTPEQVYSINSAGAIVAAPISLGSATDTIVLAIFGTGLQAAGTGGVQVSVGGQPVPVSYAGVQGTYPGLDQVNVTLPKSLAGKGSVTIQLTAGGIAANATNLTIQ